MDWKMKRLHGLVVAGVVPLVAVAAGRTNPVAFELASSTERASHRSSSGGSRDVLLFKVELRKGRGKSRHRRQAAPAMQAHLFVDDLNLGVSRARGVSVGHLKKKMSRCGFES